MLLAVFSGNDVCEYICLLFLVNATLLDRFLLIIMYLFL